MTRHVDAETLARFRQGELSSPRDARIRSHLAGCPRCSDLNEDLAGVTTLLASVPPPPIPEHLTARIHSALAAEAALRATVAAGSAPAALAGAAAPAGTTGPAVHAGQSAPRDPGRPPRERAGRGWHPRLPRLSSPAGLRVAAAAAAIVIIAGGSYEIIAHTGASPTGASSAGASRSSAASGSPSSGLAPNARALGPALPYRHGGRQDSVTPVTTDTDFTPGKLKHEVSTELTRYSPAKVRAAAPNSMAPNAARSPAAAPAKRATAFGIPIAALDGCVNRVAAGNLVLLVEVAHYQGVRATVIVTEVSAVSPEQVWVVGMDCSGSRSDVLAHTVLVNGG
jgi:hypothetical protein